MYQHTAKTLWEKLGNAITHIQCKERLGIKLLSQWCFVKTHYMYQKNIYNNIYNYSHKFHDVFSRTHEEWTYFLLLFSSYSLLLILRFTNHYTIRFETTVEFVLGNLYLPEAYLTGTRPNIGLLTPHLWSEKRLNPRPSKKGKKAKNTEKKTRETWEYDGVDDTECAGKQGGSLTPIKHMIKGKQWKGQWHTDYSNTGAPKNTSFSLLGKQQCSYPQRPIH